VLAHKAWRLDFSIHDRVVTVGNLHTGYRPSALVPGSADDKNEPELALHRAFVTRFG
jgi:hypothetical protein